MARIVLTQNYSALIDDEDKNWLNICKWSAHKAKKEKTYYAWNNQPFKSDMHVAIYKHHHLYDVNYVIDHINGNGLDNRKCNLQLLTNRENCAKRNSVNINNVSGYRGVRCLKGKWYMRIMLNGKAEHIGPYSTDVEAAIAWNKIAIVMFGPDAFQNNIEENDDH